jgi:hypothetical protein
MYNKKVLSEATKNLNSTKAPAKKKDRIVNNNKLLPFISNEGYKQGPPPTGSHYRIPGDGAGTSIYNPTPYPLNLIGPNGTQAQIGPWDTNTQHFDEPYMDEFPMAAYGGDISIPDLTDYEDGGEYDLSDEEIAELKKGGYVVHELPSIPKKKGSKGYSRSLQATNKLFAQNPLTKKPKSKKRKVFDPDSKYYQDGGTQLPEDYSQFTNFNQTLPSNLQDPEYQYGNPDQYDLYGMWNTLGKPASFKDVQDSDYFPLQDDGTYHGFSVGSDGTVLKPMSHSTTWKEVMNSSLNTDPYFKENRLIKNEQGRLQYVPNKQEGGISPLEGNYISKVIMNRNRGTDFVDRAYALGANPGTSMFNVPDDEQFGAHMSHKMAYGEGEGGKTWMFPTVLNPNDEAIEVPGQYADYISSEGYKYATGMKQKGGFQDDIDKRRQVLRDWTYGESIGMLQKAQVGLNTGTRVSEDEVKGLQEAKTKELSYAKTAAQKAEITKRYDRLLQEAGYRLQGAKQQQKTAPNQVVQNIKQTSDKAKAQRIANQERAALNKATGAGPGSSTYVTPNKIDVPVSSTPLEDKKAIEDFVANKVNRGVAAETLGNRYFDQTGDTDMNQMLLNKIYSDPNAFEDIEDAEYRIWKRGEEKAYQNANYFDRALNELQAFTTDAPGQIMRTLEGKRSLMGQGYRSLNPEEYEDSRFYDRALGYGVEGALPWFNAFNPLRYASKAGVDLGKGNVASGAGNLALAIASGTGLGAGVKGVNALSKASLPFLSKYSGATYGNLAKAYFPASGAARDLGFGGPDDPSSLRIVDRMIAGKTPVGEGLSNIGLNMLDYSPIARLSKTPGKIIPKVELTEMGKAGLQGLGEKSQRVVNFLDKPRFALTASKPTLSRPLPISISKPVAGPLLNNQRSIGNARNFSVADVLRNATVLRTGVALKDAPSLSTAVAAATSNKPWEQKYEDLKNIGYHYGNAGLGLAPVFGPAGRALYGSNPAAAAFFADNISKLNKGDYEGFRSIFPAARILTGRQEGGDVWEEEIDDERRRELEAQGYIIEDLD